MRAARTLLIALAAIVVVSGCKKDANDAPGGSPSPAVVNPLRQVFANNRENATQTFTVQAAQGGAVFAADGTVITIQPNAFRTNSGGIVSGPVSVQVLEALHPGDMVWLNMQTVALYDGAKRQLQSGGEVRLRAEAGGEQVTVVEGEVIIHFPAAAIDPLMQRFVGEEDNDGDVLWQADGALDVDTAGIWVMDSLGGQWVGGTFYSTPWPANSFTFGSGPWPPFSIVNCDHPCPPGGDSTDVTINLPAEFMTGGTMVWIVVPEIDCMVYLEAGAPDGARAGFPIRVGLEGTIVALAEIGGAYYSAFVPTTILPNHQQPITLQPTTLAQYEFDLQGL